MARTGNWPRPTRLETHGLWPTPAARLGRDHTGGADARRYPNPERSSDLEDAVAYAAGLGLEAEEAEAALGLWPTPIASEARQGYQRRPDGLVGHTESLTTRAAHAEGRTSGALNPEWVEWLMGFPIGWTDLSVDEPLVLVGDPWPADPHPAIPRIRAKVARRKHRLKELGNAVVPAVASAVARRALALLPLANEED